MTRPLTPLALSLAALLAAAGARASEGLFAMAAFTCEPVRVTRTLIQACLAADPALRAEHDTLLEDWMARNRLDAATLEGQCRAQAQRQASAPAEVDRFRADVRRTNDTTIRSNIAEYTGRQGGCRAALLEVRSGKADLAWFLLKP
ncbi:hypothetical protein [Roseateles sp.]|uniref:hypothetical protein n=1 Tax=Roseateles sp. TaxID=1971397 RepID=UPI0025CC64AC|nr:hypothetical protein [Roseateles sp.]MBV8036979.1 hypothetical protein [Roseateles sp.]